MSLGTEKQQTRLIRLIVNDISQSFGYVLLGVFTLLSAFAVVYYTHISRNLVNELEQLQQHADEFEVEWRNLRLELSVLADHSRIEQLAMDKLDMQKISLSKEIIIKR